VFEKLFLLARLARSSSRPAIKIIYVQLSVGVPNFRWISILDQGGSLVSPGVGDDQQSVVRPVVTAVVSWSVSGHDRTGRDGDRRARASWFWLRERITLDRPFDHPHTGDSRHRLIDELAAGTRPVAPVYRV